MIVKECDNCAYGGWLNGKDAITEICTKCRYICGEPTKWKAMLMTNADRIRAMSDEEFAEYLIQYRDDWGDYYTPNYEFYDTYEEAKEATVKWLKQPAEVDNG